MYDNGDVYVEVEVDVDLYLVVYEVSYNIVLL